MASRASAAAPSPAGGARTGLTGAAIASSSALAASQLRRMRRIVDAAVELAASGGFDAVRLRDVAERSDVALGTLYKYFRSKEDLLLFALDEQVAALEGALAAAPARGRTPLARVTDFFDRATRGLTQRPQFARAVVRAMAGGDPATALKIASLHLRISRLILAALGNRPADLDGTLAAQSGTTREHQLATTLIHVWFSALVGWSAGLHEPDAVVARVRDAARLVLVR